MLGTILLIILIVILIGALPTWPYSSGWGYYPSGGFGLLVQMTENRESPALQLKLDELIRVKEAARNSLMGLEERPESEIKELKSEFVGSPTTGVPCRNAPHPSPLRASGEGRGAAGEE